MLIENQIGLSAKHLNLLYPFHIVLDSNFIIKQVGDKLGNLFLDNKSSKQSNVTSNLIGKNVNDYFTIISPRCKWGDWNRIKIGKDALFDIDLNSNHIDEINNRNNVTKDDFNGNISLPSSKSFLSVDQKKNYIKSVPLRGCLVIADPKTDPTVKEFHVIFLLSLRAIDCTGVVDAGFTMSDVSKYTSHRELIRVG